MTDEPAPPPELSAANASLLEPSLEAGDLEQPLFSMRANFLVAFFGGVYAAALFIAFNLKRMNRLRSDLWLLVLFALAWSGVLIWAGRTIATESLPEWIELAGSGSSGVRRLGSLVALGLLGTHYLRRRFLYQAQELAGVDSPNPWSHGGLSVLVAILATIGLIAVGTALAGV